MSSKPTSTCATITTPRNSLLKESGFFFAALVFSLLWIRPSILHWCYERFRSSALLCLSLAVLAVAVMTSRAFSTSWTARVILRRGCAARATRRQVQVAARKSAGKQNDEQDCGVQDKKAAVAAERRVLAKAETHRLAAAARSAAERAAVDQVEAARAAEGLRLALAKAKLTQERAAQAAEVAVVAAVAAVAAVRCTAEQEAALPDAHSPECAVCLVELHGVARKACIPCGHVFCAPCADNIHARCDAAACPVCQTQINGLLRLW